MKVSSRREGIADLDLAFDAEEPDRNRLRVADSLVSTDPARALREYQDLAQMGSTMSLLALGLMYEGGQGVVPDISKSLEYYSLASEKGSARATFNLGRLYYNQDDFERAEELFSIGVSKNDPRAMYWLAQLYRATNLHRSSKIDDAIALLRKAMLLGHIASGRVLGMMLMRGQRGYFNIFKGVFYFYASTFKGLLMFIRNPSNELLLDNPKLEQMKQIVQDTTNRSGSN